MKKESSWLDDRRLHRRCQATPMATMPDQLLPETTYEAHSCDRLPPPTGNSFVFNASIRKVKHSPERPGDRQLHLPMSDTASYHPILSGLLVLYFIFSSMKRKYKCFLTLSSTLPSRYLWFVIFFLVWICSYIEHGLLSRKWQLFLRTFAGQVCLSS